MHSTEVDVGITRELSAWAATSRPEDIPPAVRASLRRLIADGLACAVFGADQEWSRVALDVAAQHLSEGSVSVWGTPRRIGLLGACLANGTATHAFEYDDLHPQAVVHAGAQVLPAVLGTAEWLSAQGVSVDAAEAFQAIAVGFEAAARIGAATGAGQLARGFHASPNTAGLASALATSRLLGADEKTAANAIGIAASFGGYLMGAQFGAMVKRLHPGHSAMSGVLAALLAQEGLTGTPDALEQAYGGFAGTFADVSPAAARSMVKDLGRRWLVPGYTLKFYPCCGSNHTAIDAWLDLASQQPVAPESITRIVVECSTLTKDHVGWDYVPSNLTAAQMNLKFCLASTIHAGQFTIEELRGDRLAAPEMMSLADRIEVTPTPDIDAMGPDRRHYVRLHVHRASGGPLQTECESPRGSAARPMTETERHDKLHKLLSRRFDEAEANDLIARWEAFGPAGSFDVSEFVPTSKSPTREGSNR